MGDSPWPPEPDRRSGCQKVVEITDRGTKDALPLESYHKAVADRAANPADEEPAY